MIAFLKKHALLIAILAILFIVFNQDLVENWATSPGTMIQLASSSGHYPFWRFGYGYRWPYYRFMYPWYGYMPGYSSYSQYAHWPRPNHYYKYY